MVILLFDIFYLKAILHMLLTIGGFGRNVLASAELVKNLE